MARKPNIKRQVSRSVEVALAHYLNKSKNFKGCAVIEYSSSDAAPEELPCIIINCIKVSRTPDTPAPMMSRTANVIATLTVESGQTSIANFEKFASHLEDHFDCLDDMQAMFNPPSSGRDTRPTRGLRLRYIDEFQTDSATDGTLWELAVGLSLILDHVDG